MTMREKPILVFRNKWSRRHKTETRVFARKINETFCVQEGCKFRGRHAQQGVCHTREPYVAKTGGWGWRYHAALEEHAEEHLRLLRKLFQNSYAPKLSRNDYVAHLESGFVCNLMNEAFTMDELVRRRRECALLRLRVESLAARVRKERAR
jgi:hypothetical protein